MIVNAHGALIRLREAVLVGQRLRIKNLMTNEQRPCVVADINPGHSEIAEIGVAFAESCPEFWRVWFPPEDWSPHSPEARPAGANATSRKFSPELVGTKR